MRREDGLKFVWTAGYVVLLAVIVAYSWIGYSMGPLSLLLLHAQPWVPPVVAFLCGVSVYFFIPSLPKSSGATIVMCILAYVIALAYLSLQKSFIQHLFATGMQSIIAQAIYQTMRLTVAPLSLYVVYIILPSLAACLFMYRFFGQTQNP